MARAGADRFQRGETLWLIEEGVAKECRVLKPTGQTPMPELVEVRFSDGKIDYLLPITLYRDREAVDAHLDALGAWYAARKAHGMDSPQAKAARTELFAVCRRIMDRHPYRTR